MKKLIVAAVLGSALFLLAPIASAATTVTVEGLPESCKVAGNAKFEPPGLSVIPTPLDYEFKSTSVACTTVPPTVNATSKISVKGRDTLWCVASPGGGLTILRESVPGGVPVVAVGKFGEGSVTYEYETEGGGKATRTNPFLFYFNGVANKVDFEAQEIFGSGTEVDASGFAKFPEEAAPGCATGITTLGFTATVDKGSKL